MMELLPAIDLVGGQAVRLVQGDFERSTTYGDPLEVARRYLDAGARWLHVVDLDAARTGEPANRDAVLSLVALARARDVAVQIGGGVRTEAAVDDWVAAGVGRVVLGTAAIEDPGLARRAATRHPHRVALGLDYRRRPDGALEAASRGWLEGSGRTIAQVLEEAADLPLGAVVVTAIERDGTLGGPDLGGLARVLDLTALPVVASGGVGSADHLRSLAGLRSSGAGRGLAGAVVGRALVDGRMDTGEAIAACAPCG